MLFDYLMNRKDKDEACMLEASVVECYILHRSKEPPLLRK